MAESPTQVLSADYVLDGGSGVLAGGAVVVSGGRVVAVLPREEALRRAPRRRA